MKIESVEAIPVEVGVKSLDDGGLAPYVSNHDAVESVERMLVRVETEDGVIGWGEMLVTMKSASATKAVIDNVIAPRAEGRRVDEIRPFIEEFYFPYVNVEPFIGAVETALWDAYGKVLGAPVSELLGGRIRDSVPVAFCLGILDAEESAIHARRAADAEFDVLKTKAGPDWGADVERIVAMHDATDGRLEFRLDPNQGWSFENAVRAIARLEDEGIYLQYAEQPLPVDQFGAYEKLRSRLRTPIAVNEDTYVRHNFFHLASQDAIDVAVIDLIPAGGILRAKELGAVAANAGISLSHHCGFDLGVKTAAMLHVVASTPEITLPPDTVYYAWEESVLKEPIALESGEMTVPNGPGLGVEVDESAVENLRID